MANNIPVIQQVYNKLGNRGPEGVLLSNDESNKRDLNPSFIGEHDGRAVKPYIIIQEGSQMPSLNTNRTGQRIIDIIVFVPLGNYFKLDPYMKEIRSALSELSFLEKTGNETPAIVDDDRKAYTTSIQYLLMKELIPARSRQIQTK